jgi:hypothetical protein
MTTETGASLTRPWRKSSRSTGGNECVEVAQTQEACLVRDSTQPGGTCLPVGRRAWAGFTQRIKDGTAVS